ncbi:DNA replication factor Cdt1 [Papilio machaon]|uniref:DNA replication factor Cdt1 n=1 Tax=Papilio machaon TaxID=76193 RepID=A0A194QUL4_PAPMA|nr:DNA replication factor Cdt1 [Papilio machaon]
MAQTTITTFFNSRKRPASEDLVNTKHKLAHIERIPDNHKETERNSSSLKNNDVDNKNLKPHFTCTKVLKTDKKDKGECHSTSSNGLIRPSNQLEVFAKKVNANNIAKPSLASETVSLNSARKELSLGAKPSIPSETVTGSARKELSLGSKPSVSLNSARKELSLGDIRKKLASSSRLAEIKATAERLSKNIPLCLEGKHKQNLKEFKSIDVDVPISPSKLNKGLSTPKKEAKSEVQLQRPIISPRKVLVSPVKSPNKVPAFIKFASLSSSTASESHSSLPLPYQYRFVGELFRSMETIVGMLYSRNEKITFTKLQPSIQEMLKRRFTLKHLAQIKQLVPDFYNYSVEKVKNFTASCQKESYELVISPNLPNEIKTMNLSVLLERRRYFFNTLLQMVKKHHAQFLASLDPPMEIPDDKLIRWHPEFEIEKLPEIPCAKLPEMPNTEKISSAQDVLAKARELFKCNPKMGKALEKLTAAKVNEEKITTDKAVVENMPNTSTTKEASQQTAPPTFVNPAFKGLPTSLLEKVKAKQAAKALQSMMKTTEKEQQFYIYSGLPDLAKTIRNIFVSERKNVLTLSVVLSKLDCSFKTSASDLQRDIKLLTEKLPDWIKLHEIRNTTYLKIDKNRDLKEITTKLEALAAEFKTD